MLSQKSIARYLATSLGDKLRLVLDMCRDSSRFLLIGKPDHVARKFELIRRENDARNENMLKAIARTRKQEFRGEAS